MNFLQSTDEAACQQIVFFDGVCGLCNKTVDCLISLSKGQSLLFAPLQGETAARLLPADQVKDLDTIVYWRRGALLTRSTAVLSVLRDIGGVPALAALFLLVPRPLRDWAYGVVASNRYAWFGKRDTCRMPTPEERSRFRP